MKFRRALTAIDTYAVGMPHRLVVGGVPNIYGKTMKEKQQYFERNLDYIRTMLVKGLDEDKALVAALITEPTTEEANVGLIWMDKKGCFNFCGSGTFAVGTTLIETGIVQALEPVTEIVVDTTIGLLKLRAEVAGESVQSVTTRIASPALFYKCYDLDVPGIGQIPVDIPYGPNFFQPMINARKMGIEIDLENAEKLEKLAFTIRDKLNESIELRDPGNGTIRKVQVIQFYDPEPANPQVDCRCAAMLCPGMDLTPSGNSTHVHMATLHAKGKLSVGDQFVMESIIGAVLKGKIVEEAKYGDYKAILSEITGTARIMRFVTIVN